MVFFFFFDVQWYVLSATDKTDHSLWKTIRQIKRPRVQIQILPIGNEDGTWARNEQGKAENIYV